MGLKTVILQGRLTKDPESKQTKNGVDICSFTVAVDSNKPQRDGQRQPSSFFRITVFGKRGQTCSQYLSKGDEVTVSGDIELDTYQAQDGKTYSNMQVVANEVHFGRKSNNTGQQQQRSDFAPQQSDPVYSDTAFV